MGERVINADGIEALCRRLAPRDLAGVPLYVLVEIPPDRLTADAEGWTYVGMDAHYRDVIGDRWGGRGPAFALNLAAVRASCHFAGDAPDRARAVALHEFGHVLVHGTDRFRRMKDVRRLTRSLRADAVFFAGPSGGPAVTDPDLDDSHGPDFIRAACHLLHRAEALGVHRADLFPRVVTTDGRRPRYVGAHKYAAALGDEMSRMADAPFAEIIAAPMPPALVALWGSEFAPRPSAVTKPTEAPCPPRSRP